MAKKKGGIKGDLNQRARTMLALQRPTGVAGKPFPLRALAEEDPQNPLVIYSEQPPADFAKLLAGMPVPSMMTAHFNALPRVGVGEAVREGRKKFLFGEPGIGKAYMKQLLDRKPKA